MVNAHFDTAKTEAIKCISDFVNKNKAIEKAVLIIDIFAHLRVVLWGEKEAVNTTAVVLNGELKEKSSPFWSGDIWKVHSNTSDADREMYNATWKEGAAFPGQTKLRLLERYRTRGGWIAPERLSPPWPYPNKPDSDDPLIVAFYSFKGGVGRSTALASFALQRAQAGDRVVVIDLDLDAPGIGTLLACDENGGTAPWGVVDYLLEKQFKDFVFQDYYHSAALPNLDPRPKGEIIVFPAGKINDEYIGKLVRLDLEPTANNVSNALRTLLMDVKKELKPNWILLDVRAGLSEISGLIADGLSHLYVVFGTESRQSLQGIGIFFDSIGRRRIIAGVSQLDCLVVHAMVPRNPTTSDTMKTRFEAELNELLGDVYYAASDTEVDGDPWTISDAGQSNAPDVPIMIQYDEALVGLDSITRDVEKVTSGGYRELNRRILERFGKAK